MKNIFCYHMTHTHVAYASPATVSRCGMLYIDPNELKWMPYVQTWIKGLGTKVVHVVSPSSL